MPIPARMSRITHTCTWNTYTSEKRCPSISVKGAEMSSLLLYCKHVITSTRDRDHEITKRCLRKSGITSSKWLVHHRDKKKACFRSGFAAAHSASGQLPSQQSPQAGLTGWLLRRCFPFWNMTGMWRERERERERPQCPGAPAFDRWSRAGLQYGAPRGEQRRSRARDLSHWSPPTDPTQGGESVWNGFFGKKSSGWLVGWFLRRWGWKGEGRGGGGYLAPLLNGWEM